MLSLNVLSRMAMQSITPRSSSAILRTTTCGNFTNNCRFLKSDTPLQKQQQATLGSMTQSLSGPSVPDYLEDVYWWAYVRPRSISILDSQSIVNAILWGNFNQLREAALEELADNSTDKIQGHTLQVACVYGNFTEHLCQRMAPNNSASLDVVDVVPAQLDNLKHKLEKNRAITENRNNITLSCYNADNLGYASDSFDQAIFFFLLHEMPNTVRLDAISEAIRVLKPGGKMVFVDYHRPTSRWHRFLLSMVFDTFEPFAKDMWNNEIENWLPKGVASSTSVQKQTFCGGLYQKVVVEKK